jgi:hypothetical protein
MADEEIIEGTAAYTPADQWDAAGSDGGRDLVLPSGRKVRVAEPPVILYAMTGRIPAHIRAAAKHHAADGGEWTAKESQAAIDWLVASSFVEPKVSVSAKDGHVPIAKLSDADKQAVMIALNLVTLVGALG